MANGRKPDFNLSAKPRDGRPGNKVGAGWINDDGSISISLNIGVTLSWNDDLFLGLFPVEGRANRTGRSIHRTPYEKPAYDGEGGNEPDMEPPFGVDRG
jgi:hypothetical protein